MIRGRLPAAAAVLTAMALALTACTGPSEGSTAVSSSAAPCVRTLPRDARAYFIGDSWTRGYGVADGHSFPWVASALLGWTPRVDGEDGTGYVYSYNPDGRLFPVRAATVPDDVRADVVVVTGGINDQPNGDLTEEGAAARRTIRSLKQRFPDAAIVLVGPGPNGADVPTTLLRVDDALRGAAASEEVPYISPLGRGWFTEGDVARYIDPATQHLNDAGQVYFAGRLAVGVLEDSCGASGMDGSGSR